MTTSAIFLSLHDADLIFIRKVLFSGRYSRRLGFSFPEDY